MKHRFVYILISILAGVTSYLAIPSGDRTVMSEESFVLPDTVYVSQELPTLTPVTISTSAEALVLMPAIRMEPPDRSTTTTTVDIPTGLWGLPFAPEGLSDCDEFNFYRVQWGLPDRFSKLAWRESNCRNEDGVRTYCCYGYLQLYVSIQIKDHRVVDKYHACGVYSSDDINSDTPLEKQKHLCAAAALYSVVGFSAWATS